jgi:hypothetical protein
MKTLVYSFMVCALGVPSVEASATSNLNIESVQLDWDVRTWDETIVITPPFTEFVVPIELPFTPDPEAFKTVLFPPMCG